MTSIKSYFPRKETTIGKHLQKLRESRGLSRKELARKSGVTYQSVYFIETGMRPPGLSVIVRLSDSLNLSLTEMLSVVEVSQLVPTDLGSDREEQAFKSLHNILNNICDCDEDTKQSVKLIIDKNLDDKVRERSSA